MLEIELGSSEEQLVLVNTEIFSLPRFLKIRRPPIQVHGAF